MNPRTLLALSAAFVFVVACQSADTSEADTGQPATEADTPDYDTGDCALLSDDPATWTAAEDLVREEIEPTETVTLAASAPEPGVVAVTHTGLETDACYNDCVLARWEGSDIWLTYDFGGEAPPDGPCTWDLRYRLPGVPAGTWTLRSGSATAAVTVQ